GVSTRPWPPASRARTSACRGSSSLTSPTDAAVAALAAGALVVFPTETVYGLGADARSAAAVERLVAVRGREAGKPILVVAADASMAETVVAEVPEPAPPPAPP